MKKYFGILMFVCSIMFSCQFGAKGIADTSFKQIEVGNIHLRYYFKTVNCIDSNCSYSVSLVIENYQNDSLHLSDLANVAVGYADTATYDLPVNMVEFVGEGNNEVLPYGSTENAYQHARNMVVSFGFNFGSYSPAVTGRKTITSITFWHAGEPDIYLKAASNIDSILEANSILSNK